jgi:1,4-alpha-glucan branching enzyme
MAARVGHFKAHQDLIKLRSSSDAFMSTGAIHKLYTHNADRVMAYSRGGNQDFVVVTNFSGHDKHGYGINLPPGSRWKEVFNSDAGAYGGSNKGNLGAVIDAHSGVMLPAGSTLVLQKVT